MTTEFNDYSLFFNFLETYLPTGFVGIDRDDQIMLDVEQMLEENNQFISNYKTTFSECGHSRFTGLPINLLQLSLKLLSPQQKR